VSATILAAQNGDVFGFVPERAGIGVYHLMPEDEHAPGLRSWRYVARVHAMQPHFECASHQTTLALNFAYDAAADRGEVPQR
jgi:hypothetical protein